MCGPEEATVVATDATATLNIPSGALSSDIDITAEITTSHSTGNITNVYDFQPDGFTFDVPAEVIFD